MRNDRVDIVAAEIEASQVERQRLREQGAPGVQLERNRLELVRLQHELAQALIERYTSRAERAA
jgi:hypothetical protein